MIAEQAAGMSPANEYRYRGYPRATSAQPATEPTAFHPGRCNTAMDATTPSPGRCPYHGSGAAARAGVGLYYDYEEWQRPLQQHSADSMAASLRTDSMDSHSERQFRCHPSAGAAPVEDWPAVEDVVEDSASRNFHAEPIATYPNQMS